MLGRGASKEEKLVRDDESMSQGSDKKAADQYATIEKDKVIDEHEVVTEKITKLARSPNPSSAYIEASEVRKLKASVCSLSG